MGASNAASIMTLANSIIGVSILAMPFCFKQCGIGLASLILILSSIMTRLSCHYLLKSAIMSRRRTFEFLGFHVFGSTGKMAVELSIIFLMIGTCIAFFVVVGDLGPEIIATLLNFNNSAALRPSVLIGVAVFVVLPLGMLRNVDSLSSVCTASFIFYICLVLKVLAESANNLLIGDWIKDVNFWRPSGILQCLPIFSMALSCQTQLFEIFDPVPNATLDRMNAIVKSAVNLCTLFYISVGFFGYVAYYKQNFSGNLLMSFSDAISSDVIKLGFVLSIAVTFPLVIFPCRASLNSLLFRKAHISHYELVVGGSSHLPEARFTCLTLFIITISLTIGLITPNIEIVLGLLGSTIGVIICILFPPLIFIQMSSKATSERLLAQIMVMSGIFIMVMGTYANLYFSGDSSLQVQENIQRLDIPAISPIAIAHNEGPINLIKPDKKGQFDIENVNLQENKIDVEKIENAEIVKETAAKEIGDNNRKEPPIPVAPDITNIPAQPQNQQNVNNNIVANVIPAKLKDDLKLVVTDEEDKQKLLKDQRDVLQQIHKDSKKVNNANVGVYKNVLEIDSRKKFISKDEIDKKHDVKDDLLSGVKNQREETENKKNAIVSITGEKDVPNRNAEIKSKIERDNTKNGKNSDVSILMKEAVPLPLLKSQNANADTKVIVNEEKNKPIQRDILEHIPKLPDREKRDLEFVTTVSKSVPKEYNKKNDNPEQLQNSLLPLIMDKQGAYNIIQVTKNDVASCKKENISNKLVGQKDIIPLNNTFDYLENIILDNKKIISNGTNETVRDFTNISTNDKLDRNIKLEIRDKVVISENIQGNENKLTNANNAIIIIKNKENTHSEFTDVPESAENILANNKLMKLPVVLAPSKLSGPPVFLDGNNNLEIKPLFTVNIKPMKRDLKSVCKQKNNDKSNE